MNKVKRYKLVVVHDVTGKERDALAKHADMLSEREANAIIKRTKGKLSGPYHYEKRLK